VRDNQTEEKGRAELTDQANDRQPADSDSKSETRSADEAKALPPPVNDGVAEQSDAFDDVRAAAERSADRAVATEMRRKARRSFIVGGTAALTALGGWRWLRTRREVDGLGWPLRLSHEFNEELSRDYFSRARLTPTFPHEMATEPRVNGLEGLESEFDPAKWKLTIFGLANPPETSDETSSSATSTTPDKKSAASDASSSDENDDTSDEADEADIGDSATSNTPDLSLTLTDIKQLPRTEMVTQLKCIEGWSVIVQWAGARLADLIAKYPPLTRSGDSPNVLRRPDDLVGYVSLETPDGGYYVGLDMESALHPQTLLCYEMNGQPLSPKHGAPLRLVIPVKYGIKNIKRIGKITYTDKRPADYWAERGYDWYSGH